MLQHLRSETWASLIGKSLIAFLWVVLLISAYVLILKIKGAYFNERLVTSLTQTNYYKQKFPGDPYQPFHVQHLHPLYYFFFPLQVAERLAINNEVVTLTVDGFRGPSLTRERPLAVMLGGSAAFGDRASSDETTITGYLNRLQRSYEFVNAGVPSWNSTQELYRLADQIVPLRPKLVVSYSFINDVNLALEYARRGLNVPPGTPEHFDQLVELAKPRLFSFPQGDPARPLSNAEAKQVVDAAVEKFLWNQKIMHSIADGFGFRFVTVIQPTLGTHAHVAVEDRNLKGHRDWWLWRHAVDALMAADYCKKSCLNFSNLFDSRFESVPVFRKERETRSVEKLIFFDPVHLMDAGNRYVAEQLISHLSLHVVSRQGSTKWR